MAHATGLELIRKLAGKPHSLRVTPHGSRKTCIGASPKSSNLDQNCFQKPPQPTA